MNCLKDEFLYEIQIMHHDRIDFSEGIDVNKRRELRECNICHYCYFLNKDFKFQANVCNRYYDLLMTCMNSDIVVIVILNIADYRCTISGIS